jgi:hypothetical protein
VNTLLDISDARETGRTERRLPDGGLWVIRMWSDGWSVTEVYDWSGTCLAVIKKRVGESA